VNDDAEEKQHGREQVYKREETLRREKINTPLHSYDEKELVTR
jgi:hypothetical protein